MQKGHHLGSVTTEKNQNDKQNQHGSQADHFPTTSGPSPEFVVGQVVQVNPATLLVDVNVRADLRLDADFVASIKQRGVLQPVVALVTAEGALRVRHGHRRTLASIETGRAAINVLVAGHEVEPDADAKAARAAGVDRLLKQYDENTQRAGFTRAEEVGFVGQLAAFGLSPAQIVRRTSPKRAHVDAALAVHGSELATKATERYESLTLDQAAVVAEFEDDTETVTALIAASATGRFEHVAQQARDEREREQARRDLAQALTEAGVAVIDVPGGDDTTRSLTRMATSSESDLSPAEHATCPGHVAWIVQGWIVVDADGNQVTDEEVEALGRRLEDTDDDGEPVDQDAAAAYDALRQVYGWTPRYGYADPVANGHQSPQDAATGVSGAFWGR